MGSLIFRTTSHIVSGLMLVFSVFMLLRGHHEAGGGFIGALIAVIAFGLLMLAESPGHVRKRLRFPPESIALTGIGLCVLSGVVGLLAGQPFLTGIWIKDIAPVGTPLLFDLGVYLGVIGAVLSVLLNLDEELS
jgi:multisubunit Na+/H+ antiporter MnhB subunit